MPAMHNMPHTKKYAPHCVHHLPTADISCPQHYIPSDITLLLLHLLLIIIMSLTDVGDLLSLLSWEVVVSFAGWSALVFQPRHPLTRWIVLGPALLLSVSDTIAVYNTLYHNVALTWNNNINHDGSWPYTLWALQLPVSAGLRSHLRLCDLLMGSWLTLDFFSRYTCGYNVQPRPDGSYPISPPWTVQRSVFNFILLVTWLVSPVGFLVYTVVSYGYFATYETSKPIDLIQPQDVVSKRAVTPTQYSFLSVRHSRFGDNFRPPLLNLYRDLRAIVGSAAGVLVAATYLVYVGYCFAFHRSKDAAFAEVNREPLFPPAFVRTHTVMRWWHSLITPHGKRSWIWRLNRYWLDLSTIVLYLPAARANDPLPLMRAIEIDFQHCVLRPLRDAAADPVAAASLAGMFPFGDGVGVSSHKLVVKYLQSRQPPAMKDWQSFGWSVSPSMIRFCDFNSFFLPNPSHPGTDQMLLSRNVIHSWLSNWPYVASLGANASRDLTLVDRQLLRIVPRQASSMPSIDEVYRAVGETAFFVATGGSLRSDERDAYVTCVTNPFMFFPGWFNFLLAGHALEQQALAGYETLQAAFARYGTGPALQAAIQAANGSKSPR